MDHAVIEKKTDSYLICPRFKGQKKNVLVCHRCRRNRTCREYQEHIQMALPLKTAVTPDPAPMPFRLVAVGPETRQEMETLLGEIRKELLGIRAMLS
jgi:hypothetical protein